MTGPRGSSPARSSFLVNVAKLRERLGSSVAVDLEGPVAGVAGATEVPVAGVAGATEVPVAGVATSTAELIDGWAHVVVDLEGMVGGVSARGVVSGRFRGACRRCLELVEGDVDVEVDEIFEDRPAPEGETYPIVEQQVDLGVLAREALLLALPLAPLCGPECAGPDPERFPAVVEGEKPPAADPRWAALGDVLFD